MLPSCKIKPVASQVGYTSNVFLVLVYDLPHRIVTPHIPLGLSEMGMTPNPFISNMVIFEKRLNEKCSIYHEVFPWTVIFGIY